MLNMIFSVKQKMLFWNFSWQDSPDVQDCGEGGEKA